MSVTTINRIKKSRNIIGACALALLMTACQAQPSTPEIIVPMATLPVQVNGQEVITLTPTPMPACTPLSAGMTITVTPLSYRSIQIEMTGLQPGETPILIFDTVAPDGSGSRSELRPIETADANGHYIYESQELMPLDIGNANHWQVQVIHQMGVACAEVVLPAS